MNRKNRKDEIVALIGAALAQSHAVLLEAAKAAHHAAIHSENVPDNKYDTLSLEASYVAQGQANRAQEIRSALESYRSLQVQRFGDDCAIRLTALVTLEDEDGAQQTVFLGPAAGGMRVAHPDGEVTVITPQAPLGRQLLGSHLGDVVQVESGGAERAYEIVSIE